MSGARGGGWGQRPIISADNLSLPPYFVATERKSNLGFQNVPLDAGKQKEEEGKQGKEADR